MRKKVKAQKKTQEQRIQELEELVRDLRQKIKDLEARPPIVINSPESPYRRPYPEPWTTPQVPYPFPDEPYRFPKVWCSGHQY